MMLLMAGPALSMGSGEPELDRQRSLAESDEIEIKRMDEQVKKRSIYGS